MIRNQKLALLLVAAAVLLSLAAVALLILLYDPEVGVRVRNSGDTVLRNVVVEVTGDRVSLGDVPAGSVREARVCPTGESDVHLELTTESGNRRKLTAGAYLEPGYNGYLEVMINDGRLDGTDEDMLDVDPF